jgi:hypothetical protein
MGNADTPSWHASLTFSRMSRSITRFATTARSIARQSSVFVSMELA